jgi:hypothetical protein
MPACTLPESKRMLRQNIQFLREYAKWVVLEGNETLSSPESVKDVLMKEVWKTSHSFNLTERDVAILLYKGVLPTCY